MAGWTRQQASELSRLDWDNIAIRINAYAAKSMRGWPSLGSHEDVAHDAIRMFFDPAYADWKGGEFTCDSVVWALCSVINGILSNARKKLERQRKARTTTQIVAEGSATRPNPESATQSSEQFSVAIDSLLQATEKDPIAQKLMFLFAEGTKEAKAQAEAIGRPLEEIMRGRRRLQVHIDKVRKEIGYDEQ